MTKTVVKVVKKVNNPGRALLVLIYAISLVGLSQSPKATMVFGFPTAIIISYILIKVEGSKVKATLFAIGQTIVYISGLYLYLSM